LLEGLEVTEVNLSESLANKDIRMDSAFYTKRPKKNPRLMYKKIGDILKSSQYGISVSMNEDKKGYQIYRMNEIHNMLCDLSVDKYADISAAEFRKFELKNRDVLFNRTNSFEWVGRTGIYYQNDAEEKTFASYLVRFNPDEHVVLPEYLTAFLNSKQGVWDVKRRARQSINQTNVNPEEVKEIEIPILPMDFQKQIRERFEKANKSRILSQSLYQQAEELLLETVGLKNFSPSTKSTNVKSFKESFLGAGRLDAEFYLPKYEEIENRIKQNSQVVPLGNVLLKIDTGEYSENYYKKDSMKGLTFYIRSTNIKDGLIEIDDNYFVPQSAFQKISRKGDIVTARVGSIGVFGTIREELAGAIYSDNVLCFNLPDTYIPEVYTLLFNTTYYFELIDKLARGSVQQRLNQETLKDLTIPIIDFKIQQEIADLIEESFTLRLESEKMLAEAKEMVEKEIEKGNINNLQL